MGSLERWYRAVEDLPSKYPEVDICEVFPLVVDLYLKRLEASQVVDLMHRTPLPLIREILGILTRALAETDDDGGPSPGGVGARKPVPPSTLSAGLALAFPSAEDGAG